MKTGRARLIWLVTALLVFSLAAVAGKPGSIPEVPVISTIEGTGVLADATVANYRLQSDLSGDYFHNVESVVSHLQGGEIGKGAGDWELATDTSSVRRFTVDLRETVAAGATPPFSYSAIPGRFIAKCHLVSPASIGGMKGLNTSMICFMNLSFTVGRDAYVLTMNHGAYSDVDDVKVTCTDVSGDPSDPNAPCTGWTIDPSVVDSTGARNRARLFLRGKGGTLVDRGRYYMRFHIAFHK